MTDKNTKTEKPEVKQDANNKVKPAKDKNIKIKQSEYDKLNADLKEYKDKYFRLAAEFDNARKRMERDKQEFVKYANEGLIVEFLDILDDLDRTIEAAKVKHQDYEAFLKGIEMVSSRVNAILKKNGVKQIEARGKLFDPHSHEVLMQEDNDDVEEGTVLDEFQKGYLFGDRVIRTSKVKVSKKSKENKNASSQANKQNDNGG